VAELLVVVEILVAQGQAEDALGQERPLRMFEAFGVAGIRQGAVESVEEPQAAIDLAEEQGAGIGGEGAAGEIRFEAAGIESGKVHGVWVTLCHRGGPLGVAVKLC